MDRENGITVKRLMEAPIMRQSTVLAGQGGMSNVITRANTYADDDIFEWVSPYELLLITWPNFVQYQKSVEDMVEFTTRMAAKKIAAFAIKFSSPEQEVPKAMQKQADKLNLPLIIIDPVTAVADVSTEVFNQIFALQAELLRKHEQVYDSLLSTLAEGGGIRDVLAIVNQATGNPVGFAYADKSDPIVVVAESQSLSNALKEDVRGVWQRYARRNQLNEGITTIGDKTGVDRLTVPVIAKHQMHGTIFIWGMNQELSPFDRSAVESVSASVALLVVQEKSLREIEIKHSAEFVSDLFTEATRNDALERARIFNLDVEETYQMVIIRLVDCSDEKNEVFCSRGVYDYIYDHMRWVTATMQSHGLWGLVTARRADFVVIVGVSGADFESRLHAFCESVAKQLSGTGGSRDPIDLRIGIGKPYKHLKNIWRSHADADKTLVVGSRLYDSKILKFSDLGVFRILVQGEVNEELEQYFTETLRPLLDYDKKKSTDLVRTLESYFKNNSNINKTSEELFTHYNTILYRLERIQEITKLDLNDANDRLNLELAMRLRSLFP